MSDKVMPGPVHSSACIKEAVCVHTRKIYDSCRIKECMHDLRVYLTRGSQELLERAVSVRVRKAELLWTYIDVEAAAYNRGFYDLEIRFFYRITGDASCGTGRPCEITGLTSYTKRVVLFGGEGSIRSFSSQYRPGGADFSFAEKSNLPIATVETVEPLLLGSNVVDRCACCDCELTELPEGICGCFEEDLQLGCEGKRLTVSLGQFGIIRIERDSQVLIPTYDYCVPQKECSCAEQPDPCSTFSCLGFPVGEFFPGADDATRTNPA